MLFGCLAVWVALVAGGCMNPSMPVDYLMNLGCAPVDPGLCVDPAVPRLVVLQHGLWRSSAAFYKLERSLRASGYQVLNTSYPSTRATIERHAERLAQNLETWLAAHAEPREIWFVGHSMGGMVIEAYLRRADARPATGCVFLGVPHRGAVYADPRADGWLFKLLLGTQASRQLVTTDPLHQQPLRNLGVVGNIIGSRGDARGYKSDIPGDDDTRVGVAEAHLPMERDAVLLRMGHTRLTLADASLRQVLFFLKHRRFDQVPP